MSMAELRHVSSYRMPFTCSARARPLLIKLTVFLPEGLIPDRLKLCTNFVDIGGEYIRARTSLEPGQLIRIVNVTT